MTMNEPRVLIIGATGFIGRMIAGCLIDGGVEIVPAVRDVASARRRFPGAAVVSCDLARDDVADWTPRLTAVDAVVNAAGLLDSGASGSLQAVHVTGVERLISACAEAGCRRFIHLSAVSADAAAGTNYARSKLAAEDRIRASDLDWTILRPSLVYGAGSFGGTSLLRGLAGFPLVTPIPGKGEYLFQPIHGEDLALLVRRCILEAVGVKQVLEPVGPEQRTLLQIVQDTRRWLDLPARPVFSLPLGPIKLASRLLGGVFGGPFSPTAIRQMEYGNTGDYDAYLDQGRTPARSMAQAFARAPSTVQDRWHARLYFLRPGLRLALFFLWLASGLTGLFHGQAESEAIAQTLGLAGTGEVLRYGFSILDLLLAAGMLSRRAVRPILILQGLAVLGYTIGLGLLMPALWTDIYGSLIKNIPILAAILTLLAVEEDK